MGRFLIIPAILLVSTAGRLPAQEYSIVLGGPLLTANGAGILAGDDGGVVASLILRTATSFGDPWLLGLDMDGRLAWTMPLADSVATSRDLEEGGRLERGGDGSVLLTCNGAPRATGRNTDICVFRFMPSGRLESATVIGRDDDAAYTARGTAPGSDGSFVVVGTIGCGVFRPFAFVFDRSGRRIGEVYGMPDDFYPQDAVPLSRDRIAVPGFLQSDLQPLVLTLGADGTLQGGDYPFESDGPVINSAAAGEDGILLLCGARGMQPWAGAVDSSGEVIWQRFWEDCSGDLYSVAALPGGGAAVCGSSSLDGRDNLAFLAVLDAGGRVVSQRFYDGGDYSRFEAVEAIPGGGFLLAGTATRMDEGPSEELAWFARTDASGDIGGVASEGGLVIPAMEFQPFIRPSPCWVAACGVYQDPGAAMQNAVDLSCLAGLDPGVLWIPDCPALSGYPGWLSFLFAPDMEDSSWAVTAGALAAACPDAYLVWLGTSGEDRRTLPLLPSQHP